MLAWPGSRDHDNSTVQTATIGQIPRSTERILVITVISITEHNTLGTFPRNFPVNGEVAHLLATSRCNGIWKTHDTTDTTDFCPRQLVTDLYGLVVYVADLLPTCYGETVVMDFGNY